ncbi:unnamed protein product [Phaedon cochleariae]|uniref:Endonuclease-reverse transcriptase n=1 Tax=Phaedon cochleariae TaxID=80249 RepID=A0A9N9SIR6_PHACE|nr:unnamed protein product [Phaedon cochleariae]
MSQVTLQDLYTLITNGNNDLKSEIKDLRNKISSEVDTLKNQIKFLEVENVQVKSKVLGLERKIKKYNFIVYGIEESERDNYCEKIIDVMISILGIDCSKSDFRDLYRIGKPQEKKQRPIVCEVVNYSLKQTVLVNAKKHFSELKKLKIFFGQDYPEQEYKERKFMNEKRKEALANNLTAVFKNNNLIVNGKSFTYEELKQEENVDMNNPVDISLMHSSNTQQDTTSWNKRKQEEEAEKEDPGKFPKKSTRSQLKK